jgi:hypothetical protein
MYSICSTKLGDVAECVSAMRKNEYKGPLWQVGMKLYKDLDRDRSMVTETINARDAKHVINMTTATIHKKDCRVLARTNNKCKIGAFLANPDKTGLKQCGVCMR